MSTTDPIRPSVSDVSALIRARTKDLNGSEGVFNADTRPTDVQVQDLIIRAEGDVLVLTGRTLTPDQEATVKSLVTLRSAMLVELSYWPEQVRSDRSAYEEYKRLYDELLGENGGSGLLGVLFPAEDGAVGPEPPFDESQLEYGSLPVLSWTRSA